jgi:CubicO group peptidase (beta-lactamase class C family)
MPPNGGGDPPIHGFTAPGFEKVREAFRNNFVEREEGGAACAVYHRGEKVVDLWGGHRDAERTAPWEEETIVLVFSITKGLASTAMAVAHSRGLLEWDEPIATYWPEFARNGKERITVRHLMSHQAGLPVIDEKLDLRALSDPERMSRILERQRPAWKPGTRRGYHPLSIGWYQSQVIRRVDPDGRGMAAYFHDEVADPLGIEFHIGLPADVPEGRVATIVPFDPARVPFSVHKVHPRLALAFALPGSLLSLALRNPRLHGPADLDNPPYRFLEIPAATGFGSARAIARVYSVLANGGAELGIRPATLDAMVSPVTPSRRGGRDAVVKLDTAYSTGFAKPSPATPFGSSPRAFGMAGLGGSFGFADPDARLGYAYVTNKMDIYFFDDPREKTVRDACHRCVERL